MVPLGGGKDRRIYREQSASHQIMMVLFRTGVNLKGSAAKKENKILKGTINLYGDKSYADYPHRT